MSGPVTSRDRALVFAVVLPTLLVAHNVADHVVQTDHQAGHKAAATVQGWRALGGHVGSYSAVSATALAAVTAVTGVRPGWRGVAGGLVFSAVTHAVLDRRWPVTAILRAARAPGFAAMTSPLHGPYLADQALHHGCLLISALLIAGGNRNRKPRGNAAQKEGL